MNRYDIWIEGYAVTGQNAQAHFLCSSMGETFSDACERANLSGKFYGYGEFKSKNLSLWGCHLFDNQLDAMKNFG